MIDTTLFEEQFDDIVKEYESLEAQSKEYDLSDVLCRKDVMALQARCLAAIDQVVGCRSVYYDSAKRILDENAYSWVHLQGLIGIVKALLINLRKGYVKTLEELVHADVFADFLEMAEHLLSNGYKDAAAVIIGSSLEAHLRNLATKLGVSLVDSSGRTKKADTLNADFVKAGGYNKLEQKNVTAWLDLRNKAAHGKYAEYDLQHVKAMLLSVRDFIARNPA